MAPKHIRFYYLTIFLFTFLDNFSVTHLQTKRAEEFISQSTAFIENKGQIADEKGIPLPDVLYKATAKGVDIYITNKGITYIFTKSENEEGTDNCMHGDVEEKEHKIEWCRLDMELNGANIQKENVLAEQPTGCLFNYWNQLNDGISNVTEFKKITIKNVYSNIDWVLYGNDKGLKYDFIVHPGANYSDIRLQYRGAENISVENAQQLKIFTPFGAIQEGNLYSYEQQSGKEIGSSYRITNQTSTQEVHFQVDGYDGSQTLVIDPPLVWATYYGGNSYDFAADIADDLLGNIYITGPSKTGLPLFNSGAGSYYQGTYGGGIYDAFIVKFNASGVRMWATYYGGSSDDLGHSIATDALGNVYVGGHTSSSNFPVYNPGGGAYYDGTYGGVLDGFLLKFNSAGARQWATFYGGSNRDDVFKVTADNNGNVYVTGFTQSTNFPLQNLAGAYNQTTNSGGSTYGDTYILKFNNLLSRQWATYYGGSSDEYSCGITTDVSGNVYITGTTRSANFPVQNPGAGAYYDNTLGGTWDAFIVQFNTAGACTWSTYYGGSVDELWGRNIFVDDGGNIYMVGYTSSQDLVCVNPGGAAFFQGTNGGGEDAFILEFNSARALTWSTYYGGAGNDVGYDIGKNKYGNLYVTGETSSTNIPTSNPGNGVYYQGANAGGKDIFILGFSSVRNLYWGTYYGGSQNDGATSLCTNECVNLYVTGPTASPNFPLQNSTGSFNQSNYAGGTYDGYMLKFSSPAVNLVATANTSMCAGYSNILSVGGANTYEWYPSAGLSSTTGWIVTASPANTTNYTVIGTDIYGCKDTASISLTVNQPLQVAVSPDTFVCSGSSITLTAAGSSGYIWVPATGLSSSSGQSVTAGVTAPVTYTVIGTDINGCVDSAAVSVNVFALPTITSTPDTSICTGSTVALTAQGASTYTWLPATNLTGTTGSPVLANPTVATTYSVIGTDNNGCRDTSSTTIMVNSLPVIITSNISICSGATGIITALGAVNYSWSPGAYLSPSTGPSVNVNPPVTTVYTVIGTDSNGCEGVATVTVSVGVPLAVTGLGPSYICIGGSANLTATATGGTGAYTFTWNPGNIVSPLITVNPTVTSSYIVTVNDNCSSPANDTISITVNPLPVPFTEPDTAGCATLCLDYDYSTGATNYSYSWNFGDATGYAGAHATHCYEMPGIYNINLTVTDISGCTNTFLLNKVTVHTDPTAAFVADPQPTTIINPTIYFTDQSTGAIAWKWSFGDVNNSGSTQQHPQFTYSSAGIFNAMLIVTNEFGCADTASRDVQIKPEVAIYTPNSFTPNGDGKNDTFFPQTFGIDYNHFELYIYDRWGNLIWKTIDRNTGWDGRANNGKDEAQIDTYVWTIKAIDLLGDSHQYVGHVNLIR